MHRDLDGADAAAATQRAHGQLDDAPGTDDADDDDAADDDDDDDADDDDDDADDDDADDDDAHNFLLDEDSDAPNLVAEEGARGVLAGKYEMLDKIGEGGMGAVWRGHHLNLDRSVAIKVLDETLQLRADGRERFIREAKALALLEHRNVVRIYDCDQLPDGKLYLCMELLDGETLRAVIKSGVRPDPIEVIDIGLQVCDALAAAHKRGILHRDLTPSNIMRLRDSVKTIKVIDWGLYKYLDLFYMRSPQKYGAPPGSRMVTPLGCRFGTPEYMAPEMILRENPGPPSFCTDVYALGVVLYELLTGRYPFAFGNREQPRPIQTFLPGFDYQDLETALRDALRFNPEERTPNVAELREALDMARECVLAQRSAPVVVRDEQAASVSATPVAVTAPEAAAVVSNSSTVPVDDAARPRVVPGPTPTVQTPPRGRLAAVALAALVGAAAGAGGILVAQNLGSSASAEMASPALAATLAQETARARAAELEADRCEAETASRLPAEAVTIPPPPPTPGPPEKDKAGPRGRPAVLATVTGPRPPPATSSRPPTASPRPTPATATFEQAMARLEPKIRGCARKAGMPETTTTVRVRRKGGAVDMVKVVKLSSEHPFAVCVDGVIRQATLPPSTGSLEDFTFLK